MFAAELGVDLDEHVATLRRTDVEHTTSAREVTDITITAETEYVDWGPCRVSFGQVEVTFYLASGFTKVLSRRLGP